MNDYKFITGGMSLLIPMSIVFYYQGNPLFDSVCLFVVGLLFYISHIQECRRDLIRKKTLEEIRKIVPQI